MCLIITGKSSKVRSTLLNTHGLLSDIYTSNPDGIGFMYGTAKGLKVTKSLPKNLGDATAFIQRLPVDDREIAIHFRWTTHGKTDMLNCHPYDVIPGFIAWLPCHCLVATTAERDVGGYAVCPLARAASLPVGNGMLIPSFSSFSRTHWNR